MLLQTSTPPLFIVLGVLVSLVVLLLLAKSLRSIVVIGEMQVGVVAKKFAGRSLAAGRLIALEGEAGYQADTLAPSAPSATPGPKPTAWACRPSVPASSPACNSCKSSATGR